MTETKYFIGVVISFSSIFAVAFLWVHFIAVNNSGKVPSWFCILTTILAFFGFWFGQRFQSQAFVVEEGK